MGRWLGLVAGAAWLALVAVWLFTGSPRYGGAAVQAQLWGGRRAPEAPLVRPNASGSCIIGQVDPRHASTASCFSCHDGGVALALERRGPQDPGTSHPVDVDYAAAYSRAPGKYVHPGVLPPDVPLVEGKVVCTSCHDPASTAPKHVARPQSLCNACHIM